MNRRAFLHRLPPARSGLSVSPLPLAANSDLTPYVPSDAAPWNEVRAAHLIRRTGFGADMNGIESALSMTPSAYVDQLLDHALALPLPDPPEWYNAAPPPRGSSQEEREAYLNNARRWSQEYRDDWMARMYADGLREKMALFWHNHFVTEIRTYNYIAPFAYQYLTLLRTHALGNFKSFVYDIGLTPAMLIYLNGIQNRAGAPNENYARELLELFTMGLGHYSQSDIENIARALTGWGIDIPNLSTVFLPLQHDTGVKTFFGRTGSFGYDEVIDILFEERAEAIARFICEKLYRFFVYDTPNEAVVDELASLMPVGGFEIEPVLRTLLKSEHFFDETFIGAKIKSPVEMILGMIREHQIDTSDPMTFRLGTRITSLLRQELFNPPNVAGWPEHHTWLDTTTLPFRWAISQEVSRAAGGNALADTMPDPFDPYALAEAIARAVIPVEYESSFYTELTEIMLAGTPDYEWNPGTEGSEVRIKNYLAYLAQLPEFQLV